MEKEAIGFATLAKDNKKQNISISKVVVVNPPRRESLDSQKLSTAIRASDRGRKASLIDIFNIIIKDPVVGESIRKRIRHITNGGLTFQADKKEVPEMVDFMKSPKFRILLREILMTKFFGKSIIELNFGEKFDIFIVPRKNLDTTKKVILRDSGDAIGIPYENDDFLMNLGEDDDTGLLFEVAPYAIFKRNGGADYAEFCELWGIPILAGLYDPDDEGGREEMEKTFATRGAGGSVVMSNKSKIEPISGDSKTAVHAEFLKWLDEQMLIALLGQTMTSKDGSSYSQGKVHADTEDDVNDDDRAYVTEVLNHELLPRLEKRGYPTKGGWFVFPQKETLSLTEKLNIAKQINDLTEDGVNEDYWYETFGLTRGNKKSKLEKVQDENIVEENDDEDTKPTKKPIKKEAKALSLFDKVKDFFDHAPL